MENQKETEIKIIQPEAAVHPLNSRNLSPSGKGVELVKVQ
jgi:hypothetical protein